MFESKLQKGKVGGYPPLDLSGTIPVQFLPFGNNSITGGSYSFTGKTLELFIGNGANVLITGFTDYFVTGGTYNPNTGVATFTNQSGYSFNVSGFLTGYTDTVIDSFNYTPSANTFTITDSRSSAFTTTLSSVSGLTVNGTLSATTISGGTLYGDGSNLTGISSNSDGYFGATFDAFGTIIQVNTKSYFRVPKAGTITSWSIIAAGSNPTCIVDVWKVDDGISLPNSGNSITASAKPQLLVGSAVTSTIVTGWTTNFSQNSIFAVNVDGATGVTYINFVLTANWA